MALKNTDTKKANHLARNVVSIVLLVLFVFVIIKNFHIFTAGVGALGSAQPGWILTGLCLSVMTFLIAAAIYLQLALRPIGYGQTLLVEFASAVANRLLPSGLGGLGLHGLYLYRRKHTVAEATAVVSINNLIGIVGHLTLLVVILMISRTMTALPPVSTPSVSIAVLAVVLITGICLLLPAIRGRLSSFGRNVYASLLKYRSRPQRLLRAFGLAMLLTLTYVLVLACCIQALGIDLSLPATLIVFSFGMLAGTATPTPGGLGGAEAGLVAGLRFYDVNLADATAIVIIFRLLTYLLPFVPGALATVAIRRSHIV